MVYEKVIMHPFVVSINTISTRSITIRKSESQYQLLDRVPKSNTLVNYIIIVVVGDPLRNMTRARYKRNHADNRIICVQRSYYFHQNVHRHNYHHKTPYTGTGKFNVTLLGRTG